MAITWEVTPHFLDRDRTRAAITAVGTDDVDPDNPITVSAIKDARVDTKANKDALWGNIKEHYERQKVDQQEEAAAIAALSAEGKTGLESL